MVLSNARRSVVGDPGPMAEWLLGKHNASTSRNVIVDPGLNLLAL